jgi:ankyrin repeat protein
MSINPPGSAAEALRHAAYYGNLPEVRRLVIEGTDVNVWNKDGYTALTWASANGRLEIVTFLLANGAWADPHEDYDTYNTPLMVAVTNDHLEIVKKLIEAGANPLWHVGTAQMTAENYARGAHKEIHAYLLEVIAKLEK